MYCTKSVSSVRTSAATRVLLRRVYGQLNEYVATEKHHAGMTFVRTSVIVLPVPVIVVTSMGRHCSALPAEVHLPSIATYELRFHVVITIFSAEQGCSRGHAKQPKVRLVNIRVIYWFWQKCAGMQSPIQRCSVLQSKRSRIVMAVDLEV
jgi:hypothetical protein